MFFLMFRLLMSLFFFIKRDKLLDTQLLLKHVQILTEEKFYETLFSNESAVTSKKK
jgi:hypothetical protein